MPTNQNPACYFTLSEQEVATLIEAASSFRDRTILRTLYLTGIRRQELCALTVEDVDMERSRLLIRNGKGDKSRIVPIPRSVLSDLRALIGRRTHGPLFQSQKRGVLSARSVNYIVERAGKQAKLTNPHPQRKTVNPHLLRHTFARHYLKHGGHMHHLSQILGHASVAVTHSVYGTATEAEVQAEYTAIVEGFEV